MNIVELRWTWKLCRCTPLAWPADRGSSVEGASARWRRLRKRNPSAKAHRQDRHLRWFDGYFLHPIHHFLQGETLLVSISQEKPSYRKELLEVIGGGDLWSSVEELIERHRGPSFERTKFRRSWLLPPCAAFSASNVSFNTNTRRFPAWRSRRSAAASEGLRPSG
jgi:hypothetical protein